MRTRRRNMLLGATAAVTAAGSLSAPAIAQGVKELKLVTSWPKNSPGMQTSAERLAASIAALSDGHIKVTVYRADSLVRAYEVFDAVGTGAADMYHTGEGVFDDKPALNFFCGTVPYGLTADEVCAWIDFGGGQALWDEVDGQFNIKPLMATNSGVQMGGWFNKEINSPKDYKGLRYRMPGLGAEVLRRMGATVVTTPGGEIPTAFKSGAIDAAEWIGPWVDIAFGLDKAADYYYYYPGFHEPGTNFTLGINKTLWDRLTPSEKALIEAAAQAEVTRSLAQFNAENVKALRLLRADERIKLRRFSDELIKTFGKLSKEVLADTAANDPLTRKVCDSYIAFLAGVMDWGELSETGYRDTRRLAQCQAFCEGKGLGHIKRESSPAPRAPTLRHPRPGYR
jgi:TRAP-type mannitol/chloroaromatic compound transport system substrate-binding protein